MFALVVWLLTAGAPFARAGATLAPRSFPPLSADTLAALVSAPDPSLHLDAANTASHLAHILIPRAPDTANNTLVRTYIADTMRALAWDVEEDSFTGETPYGPRRFTNVIATKDPRAPRRVVLAAHFDSKFFEAYPANQVRAPSDYSYVFSAPVRLGCVVNRSFPPAQ
jgi:glutaminyl-peptide cyclotransferase